MVNHWLNSLSLCSNCSRDRSRTVLATERQRIYCRNCSPIIHKVCTEPYELNSSARSLRSILKCRGSVRSRRYFYLWTILDRYVTPLNLLYRPWEKKKHYYLYYFSNINYLSPHLSYLYKIASLFCHQQKFLVLMSNDKYFTQEALFFCYKNFKSAAAVDLKKCLKQIKFPSLLYTCAPCKI